MTDTRSLNVKSLVNLWLTLMAIWLMANASLSMQVVVAGVIVTTLVSLMSSSIGAAFEDMRLTPRGIYYFLLYLGVFLWELTKANLNMARIVLSPEIAIHPGIVKIRTHLKSPTGRMVLANSITLTPGTLVVAIEEDALFVHWIDVTAQDTEAATRRIAAKFERYLKFAYG